ncbi:MAG: hypothetical protein JEY96_03385 [Bacteroidales bacterium]|nr:hypothetical protein [Bacteroidales bacterium]
MNKSKYIILLIYILTCYACDNLDIKSGQSESFIKIFGSYSDDYGVDIKEYDNGYLILATVSPNNENTTDIAIIKTDKYGNQTNIETIEKSGNDRASKLLITNDGGFVILGTCEDTVNNNKDIYAAKYTSTLEKEWTKSIGKVSENEEGISIAKLSDGYLIAGNSDEANVANGNPSGVQDIVLIKINESGDTQWINSFGGVAKDIAVDVIVTDNGFVIIGTTASFSEHGQDKENIIVIKTNSEGNETDKLTYGGSFDDKGIALIESDAGYILLGTKEILSGGNSDIYLVYLGNDIYDIIDEKTYGSSGANNIGSALYYTGNNLVVAGSNEEGGVTSAYFLKLDIEGNILIENTFGGYDAQVINAIEKTSDGGYIMVGVSGFGGNNQICLLKVSSEGEL